MRMYQRNGSHSLETPHFTGTAAALPPLVPEGAAGPSSYSITSRGASPRPSKAQAVRSPAPERRNASASSASIPLVCDQRRKHRREVGGLVGLALHPGLGRPGGGLIEIVAVGDVGAAGTEARRIRRVSRRGTPMTKLSDTQVAVLLPAAQRPDGTLLPLPGSLRGGAAGRSSPHSSAAGSSARR